MESTFYGLTVNPFDKQNVTSANRFESRDFLEVQGRIQFLCKTRGIGLFTARPGMGKTFALRYFTENLKPGLNTVAYMQLTTVSVNEFYKQLCALLGLDTCGGKVRLFKAAKEEIYYRYKEKKKPLILIIDEAQYLSTSILTDLKMLMNYNYDSINCFTLILCGESRLNSTLRSPVHEALAQRIMVNYEFQGLREDEISEYVLHKIRTANGSTEIIDESGLSALNSLSQSNPRIIDNLMYDALLIGYQLKKNVIDSEVIQAAVANRTFG